MRSLKMITQQMLQNVGYHQNKAALTPAVYYLSNIKKIVPPSPQAKETANKVDLFSSVIFKS